MSQPSPTEVVDGVVFELRPFFRHASNPDWVCLRKFPDYVARYRALAAELQGCNMVELGVDQGGSTSYFLKLYQPRRLLAVELSESPLPKLNDFLAEHDPEKRVSLVCGVDQADLVAIPQLVDKLFQGYDLDVVIDDASHVLDTTTQSFEMLFPRLRPGGIYVIEDWSSEHMLERELQLEMASNPEGELAAKVANTPDFQYQLPMSFLICQLLMASARNPGWISDIRSINGMCEVRRGPAAIGPGTPISDYVGPLGEWVLDNRKS